MRQKLLNCVHRISRSYSARFTTLIDIKPEVEQAIKTNAPIVALESTIITHGMPYPQNVETALNVEAIVREKNAIPATIAIIDGRIKVGLTDEQFEILASKNGKEAMKTSRRDLSYILSNGANGGTTVAATTFISNLVGIKVFATGGIGGVHRDGQNSMDISADLIELGKTSVAVVSSGVKSILDIPRTLEYLETHGVTVVTFQSPERDFPAFYTRRSGSKAPYNINTPLQAANLIATSEKLRLNSGILIAVPIPKEYAMDEQEIDSAIKTALDEAKLSKVSGKDATPFLLRAIKEITEGRSLQSNIALIKNNARVGAEISVELSRLQQ